MARRINYDQTIKGLKCQIKKSRLYMVDYSGSSQSVINSNVSVLNTFKVG